MFPYVMIGSVRVASQTVMLVIAFTLNGIYHLKHRSVMKFKKWQALLMIPMGLYAVFGAKILSAVETMFKGNSAPFLSKGYSFYGAVFFLPIMIMLSAKLFRRNPILFLDYHTPLLPISLAIFRLGCFLSDCCGGRPVTFFGGTEVLPVQLIESMADFGIGMLLLSSLHKPKTKYPMFMLYYGFLRFFLDFFRVGARNFFGMSKGQMYSIFSVVIGTAWIIISIWREGIFRNVRRRGIYGRETG
jgi:Prolipoprotein diacylglyceryltransferase